MDGLELLTMMMMKKKTMTALMMMNQLNEPSLPLNVGLRMRQCRVLRLVELVVCLVVSIDLEWPIRRLMIIWNILLGPQVFCGIPESLRLFAVQSVSSSRPFLV